MKKKLSRGLIQIYTGDGKGKTTAALGQAFRAVGRGFTVKMIQFLKAVSTGELISVKNLEPDFMIYRFETQKKFFWLLDEKEKEELKKEIREGLNFAKQIIANEECNILILDEIMGAIKNEMISVEDIKELIHTKPSHMELILTGRDVPEELSSLADLVTEMKMIKHPMENGIPARIGIES